jgi:iron complex outermembrane receptor protein
MIKQLKKGIKITVTALLFLITVQLSAQTVLKGRVIDSSDKSSLPGASVFVKATSEGATTDFNGNFSFTTSQQFPFTLTVSYTGYNSKDIKVTKASDVVLINLEGGLFLDEIIVSASRKREKIQEAPAAVSVLSGKQLEAFAVSNPVQALQNLTGVDIATYGVGEAKINLRGKSTVFQSETFVIVDYRNISMPSMGQNKSGQNPVDAIDLERVEVIKGPGSALYGPGVEAGVVHFITKSPFKKQGLSLSLGTGNQKQFQTAFRYAGVSDNEKLGFKLTGYHRTAENFSFDDAISLARVQGYSSFASQTITSGVDGRKFSVDVPDLHTESYGVTGTLEYKASDKTTVTGVAGFSTTEGLFRTAQGEGYQTAPRGFAQVRVQSGGLFAQAFWSRQNAGENTWLYGPGTTNYNDVQQIEGQVQYNWDLSDDLNLIVGSDYKTFGTDSKGTINGKYEDEDDYSIVGVYAQGKYKATDKLDITAAARVDRFAALDHISLSPRVAAVYKANDNHTFRATFNQSTGAPLGLNLYTDLPIGQGPAGSLIWLTGGSEAFTYDNGNAYSFITQSPVASTDFPLRALYNMVAANFAGTPLAGTINAIGANITGTTSATVFGTPLERDALVPSTSNQFEIGYSGRPTDKLKVTLDAYYNQRNNNISSTLLSSKFYGYATAGSDLAAAITAVNPGFANYVLPSGATVAQTFAGGINGVTLNASTGAPNPLGFMSSDQSPGNALDITYFNIESVNYVGVDFGLDYYATDEVTVNGSVSWLSDAHWDEVAIAGSTQKVPFSLNVPELRAKLGLNYAPQLGFNANAAVRYRGEYEAVNGGAWTGTTEASTIVDLSLGYNFNNNTKFKLTSGNVLDAKYRAIANTPFIGRTILGQLTLHFD